jgi:hypothetical protein
MTPAERKRRERSKRKGNHSQEAPTGKLPEQELLIEPAPAASGAFEDDVCARCQLPSDDDRGGLTLGHDGRFRHTVCHLLEGTAVKLVVEMSRWR